MTSTAVAVEQIIDCGCRNSQNRLQNFRSAVEFQSAVEIPPMDIIGSETLSGMINLLVY